MRLCGFPVDFEVPSADICSRYSCRDSQQCDFLRHHAARYKSIGACCHVSAWADEGHGALAGYVTFSPCLLTVKQKSALVAKQGAVYDIPCHMPCWLIGQLSRDISCSSPGLGRALLFYAISEIVRRAQHGAGGFIVIDVVSKALIPYYSDCGFIPLHPLPDNWIPRNGSLRMFMPMPTAEQIAEIFENALRA